MKFDKETIIGIVICMVLPLAWPMISQSMGWTPAPESAAEETSAPAPESDAEETPAPAPQANAAEDIIVADEPDAAEKCDDFDFSNELSRLQFPAKTVRSRASVSSST